MIESFVQRALAQFGIEGVSAVALLALVSVALYAHKASRVGGAAVGLGGMVVHDAKAVAIALAVLLLLGVVSMDVERAGTLAHQAASVDWMTLLDQLRRAAT